MQKQLSFIVTLTFEGSVESDAAIMEVAQNIADALEHEVNTKGLAPEVSDTYTTDIQVKPMFLNESITIKLP